MKCEECLSALETGNVWERRRARRHAAGCPSCAHAAATLDGWKSTLAAHDSLPSAHRQRWLSSAGAEVGSRRRHRTAAYLAIGTAAAAAVGLAIWLLRGPTDRPPAERQSRVVAASQSVPLELRTDPAIAPGLKQLAEQLEELSREAALLDERRQVGDLMDETH
jgi:hypothetical protein